MHLDWFLCLYLCTEQSSRRQKTSLRRRYGIARLTICLLETSPDRSREVAMVTGCWANRRTDLHLVRWHFTTNGRIATRMHALTPPKTHLRLTKTCWSLVQWPLSFDDDAFAHNVCDAFRFNHICQMAPMPYSPRTCQVLGQRWRICAPGGLMLGFVMHLVL